MEHPVLKDLVAATGDLCVLPETLVGLLNVLQDDTCGADEIVRVLERDGAMTANVLRVSNSALFGARRRIASLRDALVQLGNQAVTTLAFTAGMAPVMRRDLVGYGIERGTFWDHCLLSGTAAALAGDVLAPERSRCDLFTAGLVHDLGMLVIDRHLVSVGERLPAAEPAFNLREHEMRLLGFDHVRAGRMLAVQWNFPPLLVAAIAHHHDPAGAGLRADAAAAVAAGNVVAQMVSDGAAPDSSPGLNAYLSMVGVGLDFLHTLGDDLDADFDGALARATVPVAAVR